MKIGIVGVGNIGGAVAKIFAKAGHSVILSWSRNPEKLQQLAAELSQYQSAEVGTPAEAVQKADVVVLSAKFAIMDDMRSQMGDVTGKIIIDTNNQYDIVLPEGKVPPKKYKSVLKELLSSKHSILYTSNFYFPKVLPLHDSSFQSLPMTRRPKLLYHSSLKRWALMRMIWEDLKMYLRKR